MKSIKYVVAIMLFAFTYTTVSAQGGKKMNHERKADIGMMKKELNLSEEQTQKVLEVRTASQAKMKVLKADDKLTREEKKAELVKIRKEQKIEMDAILTDEQEEKRKELHESKRAEKKMMKEERRQKYGELRNLRAEFDQRISDEDKQELARLRLVLKSEKEERTRGSRGEGHEKRQAFKEAHKSEFESLKNLAEKYEEEIEKFLEQKEMPVKERGKKGGKRNKQIASRFLLMDQKM